MGATASSTSTSSSRLNFRTLLETHAYISYLKSEKKTGNVQRFLQHGTSTEFENLLFKINWGHARLDLLDPKYPNTIDSAIPSEDRTYEGEMTAKIRHKEKSKPLFLLEWKTGNTFDLDHKTFLSLRDLPNEVRGHFGDVLELDLNGDSFRKEIELDDSQEIEIPITKAHPVTLTITRSESVTKGTFSCTARLTGSVTVEILRNNKLVTTVTDKVEDVFRKMNRELTDLPPPSCGSRKINPLEPELASFTVENTGVTWRISADCFITGGVNESVKAH